MKSLLALLLAVLLSSCSYSIYHVASVKSEQVKPIASDFVYENEDLRMVYNLWEEGGRMRFMLFNKTDNPLYIDWANSVLVRNDSMTAYNQLPPPPKRGYADTVRYSFRKQYIQPYRISARAQSQSEIPSQLYMAIADFPLQHKRLLGKTKAKLFTFTKENSPLRLSHQLTYSLDKTLTNPHRVEHAFWVDTIQVMDRRDLKKLVGWGQKGRPNALYVVEHRLNVGRLAAGIVVGAGGFVIIRFIGFLNSIRI